MPLGSTIPGNAELKLRGSDAYVVLEGPLGAVRIGVAFGADQAEAAIQGSTFELRYGDLLVVAAEEREATVRVPEPDLTVETEGGTVRVTHGDSTRIATYHGSAIATLLGETVPLSPWRQLPLRNGRLPAIAAPIELFATDPVDVFAASDVLALESELQGLMRGFEAQFGTRLESLDDLAPIERDARLENLVFLRPVLARWRSGEVIVGLVLSLLFETTAQMPLAGAFSRVRALLEDQRASWAVAAVMLGFEPADVIDRVTRAVALYTGDVTPGQGDPINAPPDQPPPPPPSFQPSPTRSSSRPSPSPSPSPSRTRRPSPSPSRSPSPSPTPTQSSPSPSPTLPNPSGSCNPTDQVLGNC